MWTEFIAIGSKMAPDSGDGDCQNLEAREFSVLCLCRRLAASGDVIRAVKACVCDGRLEPEAQELLLRCGRPKLAIIARCSTEADSILCAALLSGAKLVRGASGASK